jgi:hypothetical protein
MLAPVLIRGQGCYLNKRITNARPKACWQKILVLLKTSVNLFLTFARPHVSLHIDMV